MSSKTNDGAMGARSLGRTIGVWSSATLASMMLAACGGGGGGGDSGSVNTPPPPPTTTPPPPPPPPSNAAPVPNAGGDETVALPTDNKTVTGSATDDGLPSGSTISYQWELASGPSGPNNTAGAIIASPTAASTNIRFVGGPGDYVFNFKASDGSATGTVQKRVTVQANTNTYPVAPNGTDSGWTTALPGDVGMNATKLDEARDYSTSRVSNDTEGGYIIRNGKLVYQWGNVTFPFEMKSTTKSMGGLALLLALDEGKVTMSDNVAQKLPSGIFGTDPQVTIKSGVTGSLSQITVGQLATHTSGLSKLDSAPRTLDYNPGTEWSYSDQGLNWLADVLTTSYAKDLNTLMFERVFSKLGIGTADLQWRTNAFRTPPTTTKINVNGVDIERRELASGINADVNAMARVGLLMLRKGVWGNESLLSNSVVATATTPPASVASLPIADPVNYPGATTNYGVLWWTNAAGEMPNVPKDAFWAWGLHETFIIVIPSLDLVVARAGNKGWNGDEVWNADYGTLEPFLQPIVDSIPK